MSTAIDDADDRASLDVALAVAPRFRLDESRALGLLGEVSRATSRWRTAATRNGLSPHDCDDMAPAFEHAQAQQARQMQ